MRGQPTWRFRDDEKNDKHGDKENALENTGNAPGERCGIRLGKTIVDPICQENAQVESGQLHANVCYLSEMMDNESKRDVQSPLVAFGENSDWNTGTVLLMKPIPTPLTIRATTICARVYAVA